VTQSYSHKKEPEEDIDEPEDDTTLFIKNINFNTVEDNITKVIYELNKNVYYLITMYL